MGSGYLSSEWLFLSDGDTFLRYVYFLNVNWKKVTLGSNLFKRCTEAKNS